jgi:hypothetical protein
VRTSGGPAHYEIRVEGVLDSRWAAWFGGLHIERDDTQTIISGPLADQAALHGLLNKIRDLGLCLISVRRLDPPKHPPPEGGDGTSPGHGPSNSAVQAQTGIGCQTSVPLPRSHGQAQ